MFTYLKRCCLAVPLCLISVPGAHAEMVNLISPDGSFSASGDFVSFENGGYTIRTSLGLMVIPADTVNCEGAGCPNLAPEPAQVDVLFAGSDTVGDELMPLMLAGFANSQVGVIEESIAADGTLVYEMIGDEGFGDTIGRYAINSTNSSDAFTALLDSENVIGMSSRRIRRDEARSLTQNGAGRMTDLEQEHIIGVDSIVAVVNPNNPIETISIRDLARIYRGDVANWNQVGGPNMPIIVYSRPSQAATRSQFDAQIFGALDVVQVARIAGSSADMATKINTNPGAIGFVGFAFQNGTKPLNLITECGIAVSANTFSAKTEEYPLGRRLYLYNRATSLPQAARDFLGFAVSEDADGVVEKAGYIDLGIEQISQADSQFEMLSLLQTTTDPFELGVLRDMLVEKLQYDRLSTTFRFASGSNQLERKSVLDLVRLVNHLENLPTGTEISMVGFTDSDGAFSANRNLSVRRAQQVIDAIQQAGGDRVAHINFSNLGFGELAPAACNTTNAGKGINRRVEVWVRT